MMFYLTAEIEFACTDPARDTDGSFEGFLGAVMEALADLEDVDEGISSADMTATISRVRTNMMATRTQTVAARTITRRPPFLPATA